MQKKLKLVVAALCLSAAAMAQTNNTQGVKEETTNEAAFTFTEAQLGEDDDMSQNVTILGSNSNVYATEVGYQFSAMRFRFRALNQKYNDVYINGAPMNDLESGQFRFSLVGGLNQQTKNVDFALPFESNNFTMPGMAGSNNYNFRAGSMAAGHRLTLTGANRNYTARAMYTYASGYNSKGWAVAANLTYRWAKEGVVEGTFYNALSYFFGVEKKWNNGHSLSLSTWGNPTERGTQGASTDEVYWLTNNNQYNSYWGWYDGKKRNSRVVNDFAPSAVMTWDWNINNNTKLTTTLFGKRSMYKSTKLNYSNAENPQPDYWKTLPSSFYDVWNESSAQYRTEQALSDWNTAYKAWTTNKGTQQINWDRLYYANAQASAQGRDAAYYLQAKHNDNTTVSLSSTLTTRMFKDDTWNMGFSLAQNVGRHYLTVDDLLGGTAFHNINTYALGTYPDDDPRIQYDLNTAGPDNKGRLLKEGDKFCYDYDLTVRKGYLWTNYYANTYNMHLMAAGRIGFTDMSRKGYMRNGMFADNSYGKSGRAKFLEGGVKFNGSYDFGMGHILSLGTGFQWNAPTANTAFVSPEQNNNFVSNLLDEMVFSSDLGYQYQNAWIHANFNAYYNRILDATEWQNFYFDDINSFSYVSMTGIGKEYYGVELGLNFKLTSALSLKALGTMSEARYTNNSKVRYMSSTKATYADDVVYNKGIRESGTPLTAAALILSYSQGGWFIDLSGNYYDRIYLSYAPSYRYGETGKRLGWITTETVVDPDTGETIEMNVVDSPDQAKGKGGFMMDLSVGKFIRLKRGSLSINLSLNNVLNNQKLVTGGYEQSRSDYTVKNDGTLSNRAYSFSKNPKKFYALGTNGMLNVAYKF